MASACKMTKLKGKKRPKKKRKEAKTTSAYGGSARGLMNSRRMSGLGDGGSRDLTVRFAMTSRPRIKNAATRIVQPNPILGISRSTRMGKITPPRDEPDATIPKANARRRKNHVETVDMAG